nr:MAG TPA: hypothetical protein [Caudoviricetes sp.]
MRLECIYRSTQLGYMLVSVLKVVHQCSHLMFLLRHPHLLTRVTN